MIDDRHDGERRGERDVAGRALVRIDRLADEGLGVADDAGDDVVAQRQREGEDRAGDDAREAPAAGSPCGRSAPGCAPRSAEASISERGTRSSAAYDRQDHVRQPDIDEDQEDADVGDRTATGRRSPAAPAPQSSSQVRCSCCARPGDDAFLGQDQLPGIDPHQIARPQRQHDRQVQQRLQCACSHSAPCSRRAGRRSRRGDGDGRGHQRSVRRMMSKLAPREAARA